MSLIIRLDEIREEDRHQVGGKAFHLAAMSDGGMNVPAAVCIKGDAYREFIGLTGLDARIHFELNRKSFDEMRWEEIWDGALRIRNLFINTHLPASLRSRLEDPLAEAFDDRAVAVRSSGEDEDSEARSFAGLHESYINVKGVDAILDHVKLVWASLWSDRALLYRKELGLKMGTSAMPVLVQALSVGDSSGVAFSRGPGGENHVVIEAVYGLNQGLVDGTVEPDRWIMDRESQKCLDHHEPSERKSLIPSPVGVELISLSSEKSLTPPLNDGEAIRVRDLALQAETLFKRPQDVEWTLADGRLFGLQSRSITTVAEGDGDDKRPWYLSLHRSFENLKALWSKIEDEILPAMNTEAHALAKQEVKTLSDDDLAEAIENRHAVYWKWRDVYWADCIPFAHGMRLFGEIYNDKLRPEDPYEFLRLLGTSKLAGLERNRKLEAMADCVRSDPSLAKRLRKDGIATIGAGSAETGSIDSELAEEMDTFCSEFRTFSRPDAGGYQGELDRANLLKLILELAEKPHRSPLEKDVDLSSLKAGYLAAFDEDQKEYAQELLDLGRASYRLRDDDNIYLERVERQYHDALEEGRKRLLPRLSETANDLDMEDVCKSLRDPAYTPKKKQVRESSGPRFEENLQIRQLVGQPAGPGVARAKARVLDTPDAIFQFKAGEVLVCDAVDPGMTFVIPLAAGIVERRGGMLIHGAIIAREYGIPCVTGVPDAARLIKTGDQVTVDGFLGLVIVGE